MRAAYWTDHNGAEIRLTTEDESNHPDDALLAAAKGRANAIYLDQSHGEIVVGEWADATVASRSKNEERPKKLALKLKNAFLGIYNRVEVLNERGDTIGELHRQEFRLGWGRRSIQYRFIPSMEPYNYAAGNTIRGALAAITIHD